VRVCILQPSYLPWKGYFHQILLSDIFVFLDTVQYDKHGWRNRNQIKTPTGLSWLTIPVHAKGTYQGLLIKDVEVLDKGWAKKHCAKIAQAYKNAPAFSQEFPSLEELLIDIAEKETKISKVTAETTKQLSEWVGINTTRFYYASELPFDTTSLEPNQRLLSIVQHFNGTEYLSGPSAKDYLNVQLFQDSGVQWMQYHYQEVFQLYPPFTHHVSLVDLLLTLGKAETRKAID
jgi:WbqC-like protein family